MLGRRLRRKRKLAGYIVWKMSRFTAWIRTLATHEIREARSSGGRVGGELSNNSTFMAYDWPTDVTQPSGAISEIGTAAGYRKSTLHQNLVLVQILENDLDCARENCSRDHPR